MRYLPPGPPFAPLQTLLYMRAPEEYLARCQRRYGDPFFVPTLAGPSVVTGDPEAVRRILSAAPETFMSAAELLRPLLGKNSIVLSAAARHKAQRKLFMPPMHGSRMRAYGTLMQDVGRTVAARWQVGRPFKMLNQLQDVTLTIMIRAILGISEPERLACWRDVTVEKFSAFKPYLVLFESLRRDFGDRGPWARFLRASRRLDDFLDAEIHRRQAEGYRGEDVLSLLLSATWGDGSPLDQQELRENLVTLLIAGYETTSTTLSWAFYHLHRHPDKLDRARTEISSLGPEPDPDAVDHLPYLTALCNESLRMNAPVLQFSRVLAEDFELKGYRLPKGTSISGSASLIHYREDLYPNPHAFEPERFIQRSYALHEFLPFGGGVRRCLGAAFALYEMKQVLAAILSTCRLRLVSDRPERSVMHGATMGPEHGVEMVLVERSRP